MSDQTLDLRRSWQILRRHKVVIAIFVVLGLAAGAGYVKLHPPLLASNAIVVLPNSPHNMATQVVIASSDSVLSGAVRHVDETMSVQALRSRIQVKSLTPDLLSISAQGRTPAQAEGTANAVANSYTAYVSSASKLGGRLQAHVLEHATNASGPSLASRLLFTGGLGALLGALIGAIVVLASRRNERRLRERDDIADSIGVPVLTSIGVIRPSDAAGWTKLFQNYEPGVVDAWRLRTALRQLGFTSMNLSAGNGSSLAVLSLSSDPKALALGPQLAVFAASLGIPTALVVGPQQDANATAMLRAACAPPPESWGRTRNLRVTVSDQYEAPDRLNLPGAGLAIVVAVVDGQTPRVSDTMRTTATVLGVSAGAVTAEQLARVAASAATVDRDIAGILVADPDSADHTTGRVPQLARPIQRRMPTHITGVPIGGQTVNGKDQTVVVRE